MIWHTEPTLESLKQFNNNTLGETLGIEFTEVGDDFLRATMPVDHRTVQPFRLLHGGASVVLAETLGSVAGNLCVREPNDHYIVGVDINATHLRSVSEGGQVTGTARPVRIGRTVQVWQIDITDGRERLICTSRLTCQVVKKRG